VKLRQFAIAASMVLSFYANGCENIKKRAVTNL
jgi:hypothetical protein